MGLHEIKRLLHSTRNFTGYKRLLTEWEKIFTSYACDIGLITRIYWELRNVFTKKSMTK
jgi:hypothetical protein